VLRAGRDNWDIDKRHENGLHADRPLLVLVILATLAAIVTPKFARRSEQRESGGERNSY
jgi:hypothetical protein